jgi:demethylmenaquinone methyltransferase/2-methoxy-6-polyprenyl-1,4-benzoquinol methylase
MRFEWGDALELPYPDDTFDAATVGFGVRNFSDLHRGLTELARVVRPGGRVVVLEMTTPTRLPLSLFHRLWFDRIVPLLGRLAGSIMASVSRLRGAAFDATIADAYSYLPASVRRFPAPAILAAEVERRGIEQVRWLLTAGDHRHPCRHRHGGSRMTSTVSSTAQWSATSDEDAVAEICAAAVGACASGWSGSRST